MISFFELHGLEHFSRNSRLWERGGQQNEGREGMGAGCRQPQKLNAPQPRKCRRAVRCWHVCDMRTNPENVCSSGEPGSHRQTGKTALMTPKPTSTVLQCLK